MLTCYLCQFSNNLSVEFDFGFIPVDRWLLELFEMIGSDRRGSRGGAAGQGPPSSAKKKEGRKGKERKEKQKGKEKERHKETKMS